MHGDIFEFWQMNGTKMRVILAQVDQQPDLRINSLQQRRRSRNREDRIM